MSDGTFTPHSIIFTKPEFLFRLRTSFAPGDLIVAIRPDGSVEFGPGYTTLDEASRRFWEHMGRLPMKLAEAEAENAAWRKATGYSDPEALDFYLGRAGVDAHEKVWVEMLEKRAAEVERLRGLLLEVRAATWRGDLYERIAAALDALPVREVKP